MNNNRKINIFNKSILIEIILLLSLTQIHLDITQIRTDIHLFLGLNFSTWKSSKILQQYWNRLFRQQTCLSVFVLFIKQESYGYDFTT